MNKILLLPLHPLFVHWAMFRVFIGWALAFCMCYEEMYKLLIKHGCIIDLGVFSSVRTVHGYCTLCMITIFGYYDILPALLPTVHSKMSGQPFDFSLLLFCPISYSKKHYNKTYSLSFQMAYCSYQNKWFTLKFASYAKKVMPWVLTAEGPLETRPHGHDARRQ